MIPAFTPSGVLPPFLGTSPTSVSLMSPYSVKMSDLVAKFATSSARIALLEGLLQYRAELVAAGVVQGKQWIAGSFLENVEQTRKVPPKDIDVVTFGRLPVDNGQKDDFVNKHSDLFSPKRAKKKFYCDAKFVDLGIDPELLVAQTRFYFGLFSHTYKTFLWKGLLEISLESDDSDAGAKLLKLKEAKNA